MTQWHEVTSEDELEMDDVVPFERGKKKYAVYRIASGFYATSGLCTHARALLADGYVEGEYIECPVHNGRFHIPTGCAKNPPATVDLKTFPVKVEGGKVFIGLPAEE